LRRSLVLIVLAASCAGRAEPEPMSAPPPTAESALDHPPDPEVLPPPVLDPPPEPAPQVTVGHEVSRYGVVSVSIANRSEGPARVALRLLVEREVEAAFVPADDLGSFELSVEGTAEPCIELLSGAELREAWSCLRGDAHGSAAAACVAAERGRYRFVATSCDGRSRTEGEAFEYP
jgi:hypothetical protein